MGLNAKCCPWYQMIKDKLPRSGSVQQGPQRLCQGDISFREVDAETMGFDVPPPLFDYREWTGKLRLFLESQTLVRIIGP